MTIEQQLDQLEKRNKRLTVALTLMALAVCAVVTVAATGKKQGKFDTVTARSTWATNDAGDILIGLSTNDAGDGLLKTHSAKS